jgi:hypothetical protein
MRLIAFTLIALVGCGSSALETNLEASQEPPERIATATTTTTTTTTTVPVFEPDPDALCPEWHETALEAGWDEDELDRLDYVLWRESRCLPEVHNPTDPNSGSYGLSQVNGFWCNPSRYNPDGWLQAQGVLQHCTDLHDPVINLTAARAIYRYAQDRGCGWSPWATRNTRWC